MLSRSPIGVFDSGVGGLSVAQAIRRQLPGENISYIADWRFSPYGGQHPELILERSLYLAKVLQAQGCKAIVIACNTATVNAVAQVRQHCRVPVIGIEPAIKPAAARTSSGVVGVLATEQTLKSEAYRCLKQRVASGVTVEEQACPEFVSLVEAGLLTGDRALASAKRYIEPLLVKGADQLVLGCTHFSFLAPLIAKVANERAEIIDTGEAVTQELKRRLVSMGALSASLDSGVVQFWSSSPSSALPQLSVTQGIGRLWGEAVEVTAI